MKKEMKKFIPYTLPWDDMPIDLSFIYKKEKPAGKHGFLKVEGNRFVFEDGIEPRFWGTNFNSGANFPSFEYSKKVARRLSKVGANIVRLHQLDAEWSTPNIFQFNKGENKPNTLDLDPESMDRLDYLIFCLKQEGIYIYMDLLTYRRFKTGDGIEEANQLGDAAKPYSTYNQRLIELQKKFNYDLWRHINPYTGLAYYNDPAIALVEITNENDLFSNEITVEYYRSELEKRYRNWATEKGIDLGKAKVEFDPENESIKRFFIEVQKEYYKEIICHMRELGVKIPVTGTNWSINGSLLACQLETDFTDSHAYWINFKLWDKGNRKFDNNSMTGSKNNILPKLAFNRVSGKPFFISEWDNPWPNEWRAESPLLLAAVGLLQGWGGYCIHTYRYTTDENIEMIGKRITSDAIGGIYYRGGVFDTFNDPAKFGLFYHAALIFRRGDVKPAQKTVGIKMDNLSKTTSIKALELTTEKHRVEIVLREEAGKKDMIMSPDETVVDLEKGEILSDTGEFYRNLKKRFGWIDTPNSKVVYGFLGKEGKFNLADLKFNVKTDFATIALSTLTEEPINSSSNMLLTTIGRADNTNSKYNDEHTQQLELGQGPIQVEVIEAQIEIKTDKQNLRVLAINPQGFVIGYIPSKYKKGSFKFEIGNEYQSMYYLIQTI